MVVREGTRQLNGWDLEAFQEAVTIVDEQPEAGLLTWRGHVTWDGGFLCDSRCRVIPSAPITLPSILFSSDIGSLLLVRSVSGRVVLPPGKVGLLFLLRDELGLVVLSSGEVGALLVLPGSVWGSFLAHHDLH